MAASLSCLKCGTLLELDPKAGSSELHCTACDIDQHYFLFPSFGSRIKPGQRAELAVADGEGTCFFHPTKRAQVPCDLCGRFLCALCDLDLAGQHLCSSCLPAAQKKGQLAHLDRRRFLPHSAAISLVICSLLVIPLAVILAPIAIYFAARTLRGESGLVTRGRWQAVLCILTAIAEFIGSAAVLYFTFFAR